MPAGDLDGDSITDWGHSNVGALQKGPYINVPICTHLNSGKLPKTGQRRKGILSSSCNSTLRLRRIQLQAYPEATYDEADAAARLWLAETSNLNTQLLHQVFDVVARVKAGHPCHVDVCSGPLLRYKGVGEL